MHVDGHNKTQARAIPVPKGASDDYNMIYDPFRDKTSFLNDMIGNFDAADETKRGVQNNWQKEAAPSK
jgi:hypothetical protein